MAGTETDISAAQKDLAYSIEGIDLDGGEQETRILGEKYSRIYLLENGVS